MTSSSTSHGNYRPWFMLTLPPSPLYSEKKKETLKFPGLSKICVSELYLDSTIPIIDEPPKPLDFYRSFIAANKPVVVRNGLRHWPPLSKWSASYLRYSKTFLYILVHLREKTCYVSQYCFLR